MNNKGWGLAQMLILSSILIIALLIAAINSKRLEKGLEKNEIRNQIEEKQLKQDEKNNTSTNSSSESTTNNNSDSNTQNNTNVINNATYATIEGLMVTSAQKLVNNNSLTISNDILIVRDEHLYEQDAELKSEMDKYKCRGYIKIYKENDNNYYIPYIKCSDYETTGYESSYN